MFFDDSLSDEEEEDDDDFEMVIVVIINEDFRRLALGSQFDRLYINRDRTEGHEKLMKDYFNPNATYLQKYLYWQSRMHRVSSSPLKELWRSMMNSFKLRKFASG